MELCSLYCAGMFMNTTCVGLCATTNILDLSPEAYTARILRVTVEVDFYIVTPTWCTTCRPVDVFYRPVIIVALVGIDIELTLARTS